jgi:hypothetical protein
MGGPRVTTCACSYGVQIKSYGMGWHTDFVCRLGGERARDYALQEAVTDFTKSVARARCSFECDKLHSLLQNAVFWDWTPRGSCKN